MPDSGLRRSRIHFHVKIPKITNFTAEINKFTATVVAFMPKLLNNYCIGAYSAGVKGRQEGGEREQGRSRRRGYG